MSSYKAHIKKPLLMPSNKKVELKFKELQSILYIVIDIKQISIAVKLANKETGTIQSSETILQ